MKTFLVYLVLLAVYFLASDWILSARARRRWERAERVRLAREEFRRRWETLEPGEVIEIPEDLPPLEAFPLVEQWERDRGAARGLVLLGAREASLP